VRFDCARSASIGVPSVCGAAVASDCAVLLLVGRAPVQGAGGRRPEAVRSVAEGRRPRSVTVAAAAAAAAVFSVPCAAAAAAAAVLVGAARLGSAAVGAARRLLAGWSLSGCLSTALRLLDGLGSMAVALPAGCEGNCGGAPVAGGAISVAVVSVARAVGAVGGAGSRLNVSGI
jgi:hypothetical protein